MGRPGNRTKLTLDGGDYVAYEYDQLHQLTREVRYDSGGTVTRYSNDLWYDRLGNRTKLDTGIMNHRNPRRPSDLPKRR